MSKESISHRYDIEYTHPDTLGETSKRSWIGRISIIFIVLFLTAFFYGKSHIYKNLQELITSYTRNEKKDEYNNFNMSNHALPIATTEVEEKPNTDEVADSDNLQGEVLTKTTVKKSKPSQILNSASKTTPVDETPSSSITSAKPIVKKVTPKPSLNSTSNLYPSTEAPTTETPTTKVFNNTASFSIITTNKTPINTKKDIKIEQDKNKIRNKARIESLAKLDDLLNQLSTSTKNKELGDKLKNNQSSDNLSKLLASSLNDYKNNDKQYLSALEILNEAKPVSKKQETSCTVATEETKKELNSTNNTTSLSLKAQVDAIILSMQANN